MTKDEIKDKIIEIQGEYIEELSKSFENRNYGKRPEIMYECYRKYTHIISNLKSQLSEAGEEKPIIKKCRQCRFFDLDEHCEPCESCYPIAYSNWQPR